MSTTVIISDRWFQTLLPAIYCRLIRVEGAINLLYYPSNIHVHCLVWQHQVWGCHEVVLHRKHVKSKETKHYCLCFPFCLLFVLLFVCCGSRLGRFRQLASSRLFMLRQFRSRPKLQEVLCAATWAGQPPFQPTTRPTSSLLDKE